MITEKDYLNLKEMWDYQRMLEYNKELLRTRIKSLLNEVMFTDATEEDMFDTFWSKMKESENKLERPPRTWIPKNEKLRKWNE